MELAAKRFADTVAVFPTGRIDHATADVLQGRAGAVPGRASRPGSIAR